MTPLLQFFYMGFGHEKRRQAIEPAAFFNRLAV